MRGDRIRVIYATPSGPQTHVIQASRDGGQVDYRRNRDSVEAWEENKAGSRIAQAEFATSAVIAVIRDHEKILRARKRK